MFALAGLFLVSMFALLQTEAEQGQAVLAHAVVPPHLDTINIIGVWIPEGVERIDGRPISSLGFMEDEVYLSTAIYQGK